MPKLSKTAGEETRDQLIAEEMKAIIPTIAVTPTVMVTTGVNRKVNIGNFETVDVYTAVTLPVPEVSIADLESLKQAVREGTELGFAMASRETGERYDLIKKALREGRPSQEEAPAD